MSHQEQYSRLAWWCALPFPVIGVAVAWYLEMSSFHAYVERERVRAPLRSICGTPLTVTLIPALGLGGLGGAVTGCIAAQCITCLTRKKPIGSIPLFGTKDETRQRLLAIIPIGTSPAVAVSTVTSNRMKCRTHVDPQTNERFLWCVYSEISRKLALQVWQVRIECVGGMVSSISCQQAGPYG